MAQPAWSKPAFVRGWDSFSKQQHFVSCFAAAVLCQARPALFMRRVCSTCSCPRYESGWSMFVLLCLFASPA
jgi:hypothetical protein